MPLWTNDKAPAWNKNAELIEGKGWVDGQTGELLVAANSFTALLNLPEISGIRIKGNKRIYVTTDVITFYVSTDESVTVTGVPSLTLSVNGTARVATYSAGSTTNQLEFTYTFVGADVATKGQFTMSSPMLLNAGTILDSDASPLDLAFTAPDLSGVAIN